jgi:hypothetical protein
MSMTVAMYARRKRWPLEAVTVRLRHSRIHAADCEACETKESLLDHIDCDVEFTGVLDEDQYVRLLEIAPIAPALARLNAWGETFARHHGSRIAERPPIGFARKQKP